MVYSDISLPIAEVDTPVNDVPLPIQGTCDVQGMLSWQPKPGRRAAKLELCGETLVYSFIDSSNHLRYQCQHMASTPQDDRLCTTDCAVLCYYRLYFSPFLRGVVLVFLRHDMA